MEKSRSLKKGWLTFSEASKKYHVDSSTLRKAVQANRFKENEIDMVGKTYTVKESAMQRLYPQKKRSISDRIEAAKKELQRRTDNSEKMVSKTKILNDKER